MTVLWDAGTLQVLDDRSFTKVINDHVLPAATPTGRSGWRCMTRP
jgi:hypothetical protein